MNKATALPVVLHMGFPRTSTTMHQRYIFSGHENIHYIGKPFSDEGVKEAFRNLVCQDAARFEEAAAYKILRASASPPPSRAPLSCVVLSDEVMLSPYSVDIGVVLTRLQSVFGDFKVFVTIRNQFGFFKSLVEHVARKREYGSLDETIRYQMKFRDTQNSFMGFLNYYVYYEFLIKRLGSERVLMLPFELIRVDRPLYCRLLGDFLNVSPGSIADRIDSAPVVNYGPKPWELAFEDFQKRCLGRRPHPVVEAAVKEAFRLFPFGRRRIQELLQKCEREFIEEWAPKNVPLRKMLLERIGVDIAELGYSLPTTADRELTKVAPCQS